MVPSACPGIAQSVYAIGAPFGFSGSVTSGIISAVDRKVDGRKGVLLLQNDAAVNPGNSGGALVNPSGELLGIISQVYTGSSGYAGISFALPTSELRRSLLNILQRKKLKAKLDGCECKGSACTLPSGGARVRTGQYPGRVDRSASARQYQDEDAAYCRRRYRALR